MDDEILLGNLDLSVGITELIDGIQAYNPEMSSLEVETLANALLGQVGNALGNGESLASIMYKQDGNFDINIWHINPREDE